MGFDSLPSITTILQEASAWANPIFQEFQWVIYLSVGIITVISAIYFISNKLENGLTDIFKHKQRLSRIDKIIADADNTEVYNPATGTYHKNRQEFLKWLSKR